VPARLLGGGGGPAGRRLPGLAQEALRRLRPGFPRLGTAALGLAAAACGRPAAPDEGRPQPRIIGGRQLEFGGWAGPAPSPPPGGGGQRRLSRRASRSASAAAISSRKISTRRGHGGAFSSTYWQSSWSHWTKYRSGRDRLRCRVSRISTVSETTGHS